jgi:hypothetical protein
MQPQYIVWFRLSSGRCDMLGAQTLSELWELADNLPPGAEIYGPTGAYRGALPRCRNLAR